MMSRLTRVLFVASLAAVSVGCSDWGGSADPANLFTRISGRVINNETKLPISGVVVKICNYEVSGSTDGDGHWFIELVPGLSDTNISLTFERSGFASAGLNVGVFPDGDSLEGAVQTRHYIDLGTLFMRPGAPITVNVTRDGAPFANATVYAILSLFAFDGTGEHDCTDLNIVGTTNASGVVTLANLDPREDYQVVVPAQSTDSDNIPDTFTGSTFVHITQLGSIYGINVESASPNTGPSIVGSNLGSFNTFFNMPTGPVNNSVRNTSSFGWGDLRGRSSALNEFVGFNQAVLTGNGSVQLVFRTPVTVTSPNFLYRDNLRDPTLAGYNMDVRIGATATPLGGSNNTIYNFVPLGPLPTNEVLTLNFIARSITDPGSSTNMDTDFYVPILGNSTIPVRADNYNGSMDGSGGSNIVFLSFNEVVEGFYKVRSFVVDNSTVTLESPFEIGLTSFGDDAIVHNLVAAPPTGTNIGQTGAVVGNAYNTRIRIAPSFSILSLNDNATNTNSVTIEISVRDAEGNTLDTTVTLPVE